MKNNYFKRSAIHNLVITNCRKDFSSDEISEGLVIPKNILLKSDILPWEQIIVTKIDGNNWVNRIKTFVIEGEDDGKVEARGSLANFLSPGDLTCLITYTLLDESEIKKYTMNQFPIFDLGFDPSINLDNKIESRLDVQYFLNKKSNIIDYTNYLDQRNNTVRFMLSSIILGLKINKTHPDCLQGSAELPGNIMDKAGVYQYQAVSVYNSSKGGLADTYAVPMPPEIVMTTGAMAQFAKEGEFVNVATYIITNSRVAPDIIITDGSKFVKKLNVII
ncbi:MAG: aspartate 1-decarboxylase [bacterium]